MTHCGTVLDNNTDCSPGSVHECTRAEDHGGSHRCECGYVWPPAGEENGS